MKAITRALFILLFVVAVNIGAAPLPFSYNFGLVPYGGYASPLTVNDFFGNAQPISVSSLPPVTMLFSIGGAGGVEFSSSGPNYGLTLNLQNLWDSGTINSATLTLIQLAGGINGIILYGGGNPIFSTLISNPGVIIDLINSPSPSAINFSSIDVLSASNTVPIYLSQISGTFTPNAIVPEPATLLLLSTSLMMTAIAKKKKVST